MSLFFAIYNFYLVIELYIEDNVPKGEAPGVIKRVKRIQEE